MKKDKFILIVIFFIPAFISLNRGAVTAQETPSNVSLTPNKVEYKADGLRDPFIEYLGVEQTEVVTGAQKELEAAMPEEPLPSLTIQGIVWGGNMPQAIINNKVVEIGDALDGVRIVDINQEGVTVFYGSRQYNLTSPAGMSLPKKPAKE